MKGTSSSYPDRLVHKLYTNNTTYDYEWIFTDDERIPEAYGQNKENWCWAVCSKMVGEHNGGAGVLSTTPAVLTYTSNLHSYNSHPFYGVKLNGALTADGGQRDIVIYIYGNDNDHPGTIVDMKYAVQFASSNEMNVGIWGTGAQGSLTVSNMTALNNELSSGQWVIGGALGHTVVIRNYNNNTRVYTYWDPWINNSFTISYEQLQSVFDFLLYCD